MRSFSGLDKMCGWTTFNKCFLIYTGVSQTFRLKEDMTNLFFSTIASACVNK